MNQRAALIADLERFTSYNEQEAVDREVILQALREDANCANRSATAHLACSIWTVDPAFQRTLLVYHNIYDSWSWIGGHADGSFDLAAVALRELEEETGVTGKLVPSRFPANDGAPESPIFSVEVLTVDGHEKRGAYVGSHLHLNVTYLAVANPEAPTRMKLDENAGVRWALLDEAVELSTEPWIRDRIYRKLIAKTRQLP